MSDEIFEELTEAVAEGDYKNIGRLVRKARRNGLEDENIIKALSSGLTDTSKKYKLKGMYLDDIIKSAGAFEIGFQALGIPDLTKEPEERVILGVMGGPWTIGTNIVAANLKAHGFEVINAGSDVSPESIAKKALETDARIIAFAIYLMQTRGDVSKLEEELWKLGIRNQVRTILSGPAASSTMAQKSNIDTYV